MKYFLSALIILGISFSLFGCHKDAQDTGITIDINKAESLTDKDDITQKPMYTVSLPIITETETASDGTVIFSHSYQNISLVLPEPEIADKIILNLLNKIDSTSDYANTALASAQQAYTPGADWNPYLLQIRYLPMRFDSGILSFFGNKVSYTGGAHTSISGDSISYDLLTGDILAIGDILQDNVSADVLKNYVLESLLSIEKNTPLYAGYQDTVNSLFKTDLNNYQHWYFSQNGLCFYFMPYEIAPFSSGTVVAEIPYSKLTGILKDSYFPAEEEPVSGTIIADQFKGSTLDTYTQFSEVILDSGNTKILLHTDTLLYDVRIDTCLLDDSNQIRSIYETVMATYTLSPGDAIMIDLDMNKRNIQIRYRDREGQHILSAKIDEENIELIEN